MDPRSRVHAVESRFGSTYEGLKQRARDDVVAQAIRRFGSTYEGLKRFIVRYEIDGKRCFGSTYEGLKRRQHRPRAAPEQRFWQYL